MNVAQEVSALHIPLTVALIAAQPAGKNAAWLFFAVLGLVIVAAAYFAPRLLKPPSAA